MLNGREKKKSTQKQEKPKEKQGEKEMMELNHRTHTCITTRWLYGSSMIKNNCFSYLSLSSVKNVHLLPHSFTVENGL